MFDKNRLDELQELHDKIDKNLRATAASGKLASFGEIVQMLVMAREALRFTISMMTAQDVTASSEQSDE